MAQIVVKRQQNNGTLRVHPKLCRSVCSSFPLSLSRNPFSRSLSLYRHILWQLTSWVKCNFSYQNYKLLQDTLLLATFHWQRELLTHTHTNTHLSTHTHTHVYLHVLALLSWGLLSALEHFLLDSRPHCGIRNSARSLCAPQMFINKLISFLCGNASSGCHTSSTRNSSARIDSRGSILAEHQQQDSNWKRCLTRDYYILRACAQRDRAKMLRSHSCCLLYSFIINGISLRVFVCVCERKVRVKRLLCWSKCLAPQKMDSHRLFVITLKISEMIFKIICSSWIFKAVA